jgi:hypothetical protein
MVVISDKIKSQISHLYFVSGPADFKENECVDMMVGKATVQAWPVGKWKDRTFLMH